MLRNELPDLATFVVVAEAQSFTRAAGRLGASQSALSHTIRRLEQKMGVRLLTRSTRSVSPTDAGHRLLDTLRPALGQIEACLNELTELRDKPAGHIRVTTADHAAETILWPAIKRLIPLYPDVTIEVQVDNSFVDIVAERFDAGVRLGNNVDKDMVVVPIGPEERKVLVASPAYLEQHGMPQSPADLDAHDCIQRSHPTLGGMPAWQFSSGGRQQRIRVSGSMAFNRPEMIIQAAEEGFGIAYVLESQVCRQIADGRLVPMLEEWCPTLPGYHIYYASRRQHASAFQVFIEALRYRCP